MMPSSFFVGALIKLGAEAVTVAAIPPILKDPFFTGQPNTCLSSYVVCLLTAQCFLFCENLFLLIHRARPPY
jgi:hypothetical protein